MRGAIAIILSVYIILGACFGDFAGQSGLRKFYGKFGGDEWQNKTAKDKQSILWNNVIANTQSAVFSDLNIVELLAESMNPSFDSYRDDFIGMEGPFGYFNRSKFVHTVGTVGLVQYESVGTHPYTGVFQGSKYAIIRTSTPGAYSSDSTQSFTPALAIKFLRDGVPSANCFGIGSLEGSRDTFNFFKHDIYSSPVAPSLNESYALKLVSRKFLEASKWGMTGLHYLSKYNEAGVLQNPSVFPFNLVYQGSKQVKAMFGDGFVTDNLPQLLSTIPVNTVIYNIWAEEPNKKPLLIGNVRLLSKLTGSDFGDNIMFYQHIRKEEDFALRPDWVSFADQIVKDQTSKYYYNGPADLPDV